MYKKTYNTLCLPFDDMQTHGSPDDRIHPQEKDQQRWAKNPQKPSIAVVEW